MGKKRKEEDQVDDGIDPEDVVYEPTPYENLDFRVAPMPPEMIMTPEERQEEEDRAKRQIFQVVTIFFWGGGEGNSMEERILLTSFCHVHTDQGEGFLLCVPSASAVWQVRFRFGLSVLRDGEPPSGVRRAPGLLLHLHAHHGRHLGRGDEEEVQELRDLIKDQPTHPPTHPAILLQGPPILSSR